MLQSDRPFMITTLGSPNTLAVRDTINAACVPHPFVQTGLPAWADPENYPWTTGLQLNYYTEAALWVKWIEENLADQAPVKVAALVADNDFGLAYEGGFEQFAEGSEVIGDFVVQQHDPAAPTVTNEITPPVGRGSRRVHPDDGRCAVHPGHPGRRHVGSDRQGAGGVHPVGLQADQHVPRSRRRGGRRLLRRGRGHQGHGRRRLRRRSVHRVLQGAAQRGRPGDGQLHLRQRCRLRLGPRRGAEARRRAAGWADEAELHPRRAVAERRRTRCCSPASASR